MKKAIEDVTGESPMVDLRKMVIGPTLNKERGGLEQLRPVELYGVLLSWLEVADTSCVGVFAIPVGQRQGH
ncbi:MAG: hypothetical protein WBB19_11695 [Desulforhopalus sp.]